MAAPRDQHVSKGVSAAQFLSWRSAKISALDLNGSSRREGGTLSSAILCQAGRRVADERMQTSTLFPWMRSFRMAAGRLSSPKEETPLNPEDESCARLVTLGCDGDRVERPVASRGLGRMGGR